MTAWSGRPEPCNSAHENANIGRVSTPACAIGVDPGTASARVRALDLHSGDEQALSELAYRHGVITEMLPETGERLPPDWALHDDDDLGGLGQVAWLHELKRLKHVAEASVGLGTSTKEAT